MKYFNTLKAHKVDRTVEFVIILNSQAITFAFLKKSLNTFDTVISMGKLAYVQAQKLFRKLSPTYVYRR